MNITYLVIFIIIELAILFFLIRELLHLKKENKLTLEKLWEEKRNNYEEEISKLKIKKGELLEQYNKENTRISKEIKEKQNFNQSLLRIREEELDRLIEEKRKEKEANLKNELLVLKQKQLFNMNAELSLIKVQKEEDLKRFLKEAEETEKERINELNKIQEEIEDFRTRRETINQAVLREKEIKEKEQFYKIDITESDREDISILKNIAPQLKNKESLNKLIYESFVRRPLMEMIKRVTGGRDISGIYKITYIKTGEAYIGRTVDIQTRWVAHCKTACGLDGAAHTTFHTRLEKDGLWNYTFEILEEAPKDKLNEREKFYIDLYKTDTQLNSKRGG